MGWMIKGAVLSLLGAFVLSPSAFGQTIEWAKSAGGSSSDTASSIATTPRGESYVTGQFLGTAIFGPGEDNETTLTSVGGTVFVAKYDRQGKFLWVTRVISESSWGFGIATTPRGESYVTGFFQNTAIFGPGDANQTTLTAVGGNDFFLAKYDRDGELLWATQAGGDSSSVTQGRGIATTPRGESYVTGFFTDTVTFGPGEDNETALTSEGNDDIFVAKYDRDGELLWATQAVGDGSDAGLSIATTPRGESYVTGGFGVLGGTAIFGPGEPNETTLTAVGGTDFFLAKYDRDGELLWATQAGGDRFDGGRGIATTPRGESYVTGSFLDTAIFGPGEDNETTLTSGGNADIFVAKYDRNGKLLWATQAVGGLADDEGFGIATTPRGQSYVTGGFRGTAIFGPGEPNETTLTSGGSADIIVAKYDRDGELLWATQAGGGLADDLGFGIATTPRGQSYVTGLFFGTATFGPGDADQITLTAAGGHDIFIAKYQ